MKKAILGLVVLGGMTMTSCSDDDNNNVTQAPQVAAPTTYTFQRNGNTTVSYSGQTTRIKMGEEFISALKVNTNSEAKLDGMFAHSAGNNDFADASLNSSSKSIRSKTAASKDFFSANATDAAAIKGQFDGWIAAQVSDVFTKWNDNATAGNAGKIQEAGGGSTRYVDGKGLELNQAINKGLIGGLIVDQMLNNYLSPAVLDEGTNRTDNDNGTVAAGKNYTTMEHKWDEAYGYLFGAAPDGANPLTNIGTGATQKGDDSFLNKYLDKVNDDSDFAGIAAKIYQSFKLGRAAIVAKNYTIRDQQAEIIKAEVSKVIAIRSIYYLVNGKNNLATDKASAFHDLSEGFGFIYSLQFTRKPGTNLPYFTKSEVDNFISQLRANNGFWSVSGTTLDNIANTIATRFGINAAHVTN